MTQHGTTVNELLVMLIAEVESVFDLGALTAEPLSGIASESPVFPNNLLTMKTRCF